MPKAGLLPAPDASLSLLNSLILRMLRYPLEICSSLSAVAFLFSLGFLKPIVELSWQPFWKEHFPSLPENNLEQSCS